MCDVGPRDGLQNDKVTLEPAVRAELCTRIAATGVRRIEAASFVHPKLVPQMAGAELYVVEGSGHTNLMEQPELSSEVVIAFLQRVAAGRATA